MKSITFTVERRYCYTVTKWADDVSVEQIQDAMLSGHFEEEYFAGLSVLNDDGDEIASGTYDIENTNIELDDVTSDDCDESSGEGPVDTMSEEEWLQHFIEFCGTPTAQVVDGG